MIKFEMCGRKLDVQRRIENVGQSVVLRRNKI
jgi:hypothetical protein